MTGRSHPRTYDSIGARYRKRRRQDVRIARQIWSALGDASSICNVGAGTGSYEPSDRFVIAVEPSPVMIRQRKNDHPIVCATAETLPFCDDAFDAAMAVLTIHHWVDPLQGLAEMQRVAPRQVVMTFDPDAQDSFWLVRDYLPEIVDFDRRRSLSLHEVTAALPTARVETIPVPWDCTDGFQAAYWRRPSEYLKPDVRAAISTFAQLDRQIVSRAMKRLEEDLSSGAWADRNAELQHLEQMDLGYRLIVADRVTRDPEPGVARTE